MFSEAVLLVAYLDGKSWAEWPDNVPRPPPPLPGERLRRLPRVWEHSKGVPDDYEVIWHDSEDSGEAEEEYCGACGRRTAFVVTWDDLEPDGTPSGIPGGGR